jgi:hypothetical protein
MRRCARWSIRREHGEIERRRRPKKVPRAREGNQLRRWDLGLDPG